MHLKFFALTVVLTGFTAVAAWALPSIGFDSAESEVSSTSATTAGLFDEPADQYLHVWDFDKIKDPVFFFQFDPSTIGSSADDTTSPMEVGVGARWFGNIYGGAHLQLKSGTKGQLSGSQTITQSETATPITDSSGAQIGSTVVSSTEVGYLEFEDNGLSILGGFKIGNLSIGVRESLWSKKNDSFGTIDYDMSFDTSTSTVSTVAGTITNGSVYDIPDTGYTKSRTLKNELLAGAKLPMGPFTVLASAGLVNQGWDYGSQGSDTSVTQEGGVGYNSFGGYKSVKTYYERTAVVTDNGFEFSLPLSGGVEVPFSLFQNNAVFRGLVEYTPSFEGANLGEISRWSTKTRMTSVASGLVATTDTTTSTVTNRDASGYAESKFGFPMQVTVTPNPAVRFAFAYYPTITVGSRTDTTQNVNRVATSYQDGDTNGADEDSDDYTSVTTSTYQTETSKTDTLSLTHSLSSAVQIVLVKDLLRLNLGTKASATPLVRTTATTTWDGLPTEVTKTTVQGSTNTTGSTVLTGDINTDSRRVYDSASSNVTVATDLGLTLWLNPNVTFDFAANSNAVLNLVDTTDGGGFFNLNNFTVLMTISLPPPAAK